MVPRLRRRPRPGDPAAAVTLPALLQQLQQIEPDNTPTRLPLLAPAQEALAYQQQNGLSKTRCLRTPQTAAELHRERQSHP